MKNTKNAKIIIIAITSLLALIIFIQNTAVVKTRLLFLTIEMPIVLLLILTFGLGFITGLIVNFILKKPDMIKQ